MQADIIRLGWNDGYHFIRWKLKPGITGFAQIYGGQHRKTSWFWDKCYIKHHTVLTGLIVIGFSFLINMLGKTQVRQLIFRKHNLR